MSRIECFLRAMLLLFAVTIFFNDVLPRLRNPKAGLYTTKHLWLDANSYGNVMQGSDGNIYVEAPDVLVRLEENDTATFFHLNNLSPFRFNVIDNHIVIYHDGVVYEYDQQGDFIRTYASEPIQPMIPTRGIERNGKHYYTRNDYLPWLVFVETVDTQVPGTSQIVLWSLTPKAGRILTNAFLAVCLSLSAFIKVRQKRQKTVSDQ